jgi:hypothetical protein
MVYIDIDKALTQAWMGRMNNMDWDENHGTGRERR